MSRNSAVTCTNMKLRFPERFQERRLIKNSRKSVRCSVVPVPEYREVLITRCKPPKNCCTPIYSLVIGVRKKVISIGHFSPCFCHQSLKYLLDKIKSNCMYWLHWKSEKNRTEPNELDELKYSNSTRQPALLTDMLYCICMLRSKHYCIYPI